MTSSTAQKSYAERINELVAGLAEIALERDAPMAKRTTYGIGGPADVLVKCASEHELQQALKLTEELELPLFLLGGGSNILVGDKGIRGAVITLVGDLSAISISSNGDEIVVGSGATFPRLTRTALNLGWPSAVGWMGTPGQVGGALRMNAGTRDGEIGDVVTEVRGVTSSFEHTFSFSECGFRYRGSEFPDNIVLTKAFLRCDNRRIDEINSLNQIAKELLSKRHRSQPKMRSAGSLFKNPPGDFAGRLIEAAGLKGMRLGNAQISEVHANFFVNLGGARAEEVVGLADLAWREVRDRFGVELEWEIRRVGDFS